MQFQNENSSNNREAENSNTIKCLSWLGRLDSNQGMAESKSAALPLGYAPTIAENADRAITARRADHSGGALPDQRPADINIGADS
jgi:hypothetical protein